MTVNANLSAQERLADAQLGVEYSIYHRAFTVGLHNLYFYKKDRNIPRVSKLNNAQRLLLELIKSFDLSIIEISKESGISLITIHNLLTGNSKKPRINTFRRLFNFYCSILCSATKENCKK